MNEPSPKLVLFSGLGADERLFLPQRAAFPELIVPKWIFPKKHEALAQYAARMAESLPHGEPVVLGGVSLGGMVAYEIARHICPQAVILIASCRTRNGLRPLYRSGGAVWPMIPAKVFRLAQFFSKRALQLFSKVSKNDQRLLVEMFREMDPAFMHWAVGALLHWNPVPLINVPVFQIHGRRDRIIPARHTTPDTWLSEGGHLINITHAAEVNEFIRTAIQRISASEA